MKLQADQTKAQDQLSALQKDGNALVDQFKELDEQAKNPTATTEAKAKAQADAQKMYQEIQQKQGELKAFAQSAQNSIRQRSQTFKTMMIEEISKAAVDIAKKKGATFLIDKAGPTLAGVSNILYSDPSLDITDEVLAEINKDRPAGTPTTTASPGAASPSITVPGISPCVIAEARSGKSGTGPRGGVAGYSVSYTSRRATPLVLPTLLTTIV